MEGKNKPADSKTKSGKKLSEKKVAVTLTRIFL